MAYFDFEIRLQVIRQLQNVYKRSHLGGSIGLYLLGYIVPRDITTSDIDIIIPNFNFKLGKKTLEKLHIEYYEDDLDEEYANVGIMHKVIKKIGPKYKISIDIGIETDQSYTDVIYEGHSYRISNLEHIVAYKKQFANYNEKHIEDLKHLNLW